MGLCPACVGMWETGLVLCALMYIHLWGKGGLCMCVSMAYFRALCMDMSLPVVSVSVCVCLYPQREELHMWVLVE